MMSFILSIKSLNLVDNFISWFYIDHEIRYILRSNPRRWGKSIELKLFLKNQHKFLVFYF